MGEKAITILGTQGVNTAHHTGQAAESNQKRKADGWTITVQEICEKQHE